MSTTLYPKNASPQYAFSIDNFQARVRDEMGTDAEDVIIGLRRSSDIAELQAICDLKKCEDIIEAQRVCLNVVLSIASYLLTAPGINKVGMRMGLEDIITRIECEI